MDTYVAVIGPGAIGGLLAASLRRAGSAVVLVGRTSHIRRIRRQGLRVTGPDGRGRSVRGWLEASARPRPRLGCTALFLCVKASALRSAITAAKRLAGPETAVVSLLNGVDHLRPVRAAFGPTRAVFGSCYIASMRTSPNSIRHSGGTRIVLAPTRRNRNAAAAARSILERAGWEVRLAGPEERVLWTKLVFNAGVNPLGALAGKTNGELAADPALRELMVAVVREAAAVARAAGRAPLHGDMDRRLVRGCLASPRQVNSMAQDLSAGRPTEAAAILAPLIRAAGRAGLKTRYLEPLYRMVKRLETRP